MNCKKETFPDSFHIVVIWENYFLGIGLWLLWSLYVAGLPVLQASALVFTEVWQVLSGLLDMMLTRDDGVMVSLHCLTHTAALISLVLRALLYLQTQQGNLDCSLQIWLQDVGQYEANFKSIYLRIFLGHSFSHSAICMCLSPHVFRIPSTILSFCFSSIYFPLSFFFPSLPLSPSLSLLPPFHSILKPYFF